MKNIIIFFGIVLFVVAGCRKIKSIGHASVVLHKQHFEPGTENPINGEREYFRDGNLYKKVFFAEGYPQTVIYYYSNQQKKTTIIVGDQGKGDVKRHINWFESGQKMSESNDQFIKQWHENGQLKVEVHFDANYNLHGITKVWYEDGTLKGKENYHHSKLHGKRVKWDAEGNKILTQIYKNGVLISSS